MVNLFYSVQNQVTGCLGRKKRQERGLRGIDDGNVFYTVIRGMVTWICTSVRTQNCSVLTKCHFLNTTKIDILTQKQRKFLEPTS